MMYLNIDDSKAIENPSSTVLNQAIDDLNAGQFIILGGNQDEFYVQAMFEEDGYWVLEYRWGSADQHYGTDPESNTIDDVKKAFQAFLVGQDLQPLLAWEQIDLAENELQEGEVQYNGVVMNAEWPQQIEAAQAVTELDFEGTKLRRVSFGNETNNATHVLNNCGDCGVLHQQFHVPGCEVEQCPKCQQALYCCPCEYDY